ncbi:MAG: Holliday junction branch migration protein RuvA [Proteobacteria bacterium]|nr:Holliday junction branch migration protein RuvA [Pseudomonadota bacterium]
MIATLIGNVLMTGPDRAVIDVGGGGYEVFLSSDGLARLPEKNSQVFLHIHTHVREDAIVLFGFLEVEEKELFLILKTVSGIGPKLGLAILSGMPVADLCQAIVREDISRLTTLQGVGKRTAERLCVELKDKVSHLQGAGEGREGVAEKVTSLSAAPGGAVLDTLSALVNLGYPDPVARQALTVVKKRVGAASFATMQIEELIRETLRTLA